MTAREFMAVCQLSTCAIVHYFRVIHCALSVLLQHRALMWMWMWWTTRLSTTVISQDTVTCCSTELTVTYRPRQRNCHTCDSLLTSTRPLSEPEAVPHTNTLCRRVDNHWLIFIP